MTEFRSSWTAWLAALCFPLVAPGQNIITTFAGTNYVFDGDGKRAVNAAIGRVSSLIVDQQGTVYLSDIDNRLVMKFGSNGILTVVAGNGVYGNSGDGGPATSASFAEPSGLALDPAGNLYISDDGAGVIRRVSPGGTITTVAGNAAGLRAPRGLASDSAGNIYVADNDANRVLRISQNGSVAIFAGTGRSGFSGDGGPAAQASFNNPRGVAVDASGNVYIADSGNNRIRRVTPNGIIATVAGNDGSGFSGDGGALSTSLNFPIGVTVDAAGNLYVADTANNRVRRITTDGRIVTLAGNDAPGFAGDGGPARDALLSDPVGVAPDALGNIYIADSSNSRIRRISPAGFIITVAGNGLFGATGDGGQAIGAALLRPLGIAFDAARNLYVADIDSNRVRKIDANGVITTFAGNGSSKFSGDGLDAPSASLNSPSSVAAGPDGSIYIVDSSNGRIRKVTPSGVITTVAGPGASDTRQDGIPAIGANLGQPTAIAVDAAGNLYVTDTETNRVRRISTDGIIRTVAGGGMSQAEGVAATSVALKGPQSLALDTAGNLYIGDVDRIRRVNSGGAIFTIAGNGKAGFSGDGGPATLASISDPFGLLIDRNGTLYIADSGNGRVRSVTPSGIINTVAGNGNGDFSGDGGPAALASIDHPVGLAIDPDGNFYIADSGNRRIRRILAAAPTFSAAPSTLAFFAKAGGVPSAPQNLTVSGPFAGPRFQIEVRTSDGAGWLFLNATSGLLPASIQVFVDPSGLDPGNYQGTITVRVPFANPPVRVVTVTLAVGQTDPPLAGADPSRLAYAFVSGSAATSQQLRVANRGGGSLDFDAAISSDAAWLSVTPAHGTVTAFAPALLSVTADPTNLAPGTYTGQVLVQTAAQQFQVPVTVTISAGQQTILLSQTGLTFTSVLGGGSVPSQSFGVLNTGQGVMTWTAQASTLSSGPNWLQVSPQSGFTDAASLFVPLVDVSVNASGLAPGDYYGQIVVNSPGANNSPQTVTVVLTVLPAGSDPGPLIRPTGLIFVGTAGGANPGSQTVNVTNLTATPISFISGRISGGPGNLFTNLPTDATVAPNQPLRITVQPNLNGAPAGVYRGTLTLQFSTGVASTVNLLFLVVPAASAGTSARFADGCTPQSLFLVPTSLGYGFTVPAAFPQPIEVRIVDDCGQPFIQGSVVTTFSNGDPALSLASLKDGRWTGTWLARNVSSGQVTVTISAGVSGTQLRGSTQISGGVGADRNAPIIDSGNVVSSASLARDLPLAQGGLISIFGSRLADSQLAAGTPPFPNSLAGTQVMLGGASLPLTQVAAGRIDAQLPYDFAPNARYPLVVQRGSTLSQVESVTLTTAQPAIFTKDGSGMGQALVYRVAADGTQLLAEPGNAATAGDTIVIRCSGLGPVDPPVAAGAAAPDPPARVLSDLTLTIGGAPATVSDASLIPGNSGVYQVTATVPGGISPADAVGVVITAGGRASPAVTMAIQ